MADKNGIAQFLDKLAEGMSKMKESNGPSSDVANVLPKPSTQEIGDGIILWRWWVPGGVVVESTLATRQENQAKLKKDEYVVSVKMPHSENNLYVMYDDSARDIGQAILSAYNWKDIWKLHAGDFLLEELSKGEPEIVEAELDFDE